MINRWHIFESNKLLDPCQCGFREGRSTNDHLVRIKAHIRDAFIHEQFFLSMFLDMEKASQRFGILHDLSEMGIRGNMLIAPCILCQS